MTDTTTTSAFIDLISKGGWVMTPLLLCSIVACAIVIERFFWGPKTSRVIPKGLIEEVLELIHADKLDEVRAVVRARVSPLSRLILLAINNSDKPRRELIEVLEMAGKKEALELTRYLPGLAIIASISPLLGLLGTVFGIMRTFDVIGQFGLGNAQHLASGIAEALITTATGLCIAIPALVFYRYFLSHSRTLIIEMESLCFRIVEVLHQKHLPNITVLDTPPKHKAEASIL